MPDYNVPYSSAARLREREGLTELPDEEAARILQEKYSGQGWNFNFDSLKDANPVLKATSWVSRNLEDAAGEYIGQPIRNTFGDNTVTRTADALVRGLAGSAPAIATFAATRGRSRPPIVRVAAPYLAGGYEATRTLADTGDPDAAIAAGLTSALAPFSARQTSRALSRVTPSVSEGTRSVIGGALADTALTAAQIGYTPRMKQHREGGFYVPVEDVKLTDPLRSNYYERLTEAATNPEMIGTTLGGTILGAGIGAIEARVGAAERANLLARERISPISQEQKAGSFVLQEAGFDVPEGVPAQTLNSILDQYRTQGEIARDDLQLRLYQEGAGNLNNDQINSFTRLSEAVKTKDPNIIGGVFSSEGKKILQPENFPSTEVQDVLKVFNDAINPLTPKTEIQKKIAGTLDNIERIIGPWGLQAQDNPVFGSALNTLAQRNNRAQAAINDAWTRIGQNESGSLTASEARANFRTMVDALRADNKFSSSLGKLFEDTHNQIFETVKNSDGTTTISKRSSLDNIPVYTVDDLMNNYGMTREQAVFSKNLLEEPVRVATDTFNTTNETIASKLATYLSARNAKYSRSNDAFNAAKSYVDKYSRTLTYNEQIKRANPDGGTEYKDLVSDKAARELATMLYDPAYAATPQAISSAKIVANGVISALENNISFFTKNAVRGYAPAIRRGKYFVSWTDANGEPMARGIKNEEELASLEKNAKHNPTDYRNFKVYDTTKIEGYNARLKDFALRDMLREMQEKRAILQERLSNESVSPEDATFINDLFDTARATIDEETSRILANIRDMDISARTKIESRNISGIDSADYAKNLIEYIELMSRVNSYRRSNNAYDIARNDASIVNNPDISKALDSKHNYVMQPSSTEWAPLRSFSTLFYIAASPRFLFQNLLQVPTLGFIRWKDFTGRSSADFFRSLTKAASIVNEYTTSDKVKNTIKNRLMRQAEKDNVFNTTVTDEISGANSRRNVSDIFNEDRASLYNRTLSTLDKIVQMIGVPVSVSENTNRMLSFASILESEDRIYPLAKRSKQDLDSVYRKAVDFSNAVNFVGGEAYRPGFYHVFDRSTKTGQAIHNTALMSLVLRTFNLNMLALLSKQTRRLVGVENVAGITSRNASAALKNNRFALAKTFLAYGLLGGASSLPFVDVFNQLANTVASVLDRDDQKDVIKRFTIKNTRETARHIANLIDMLDGSQSDGANEIADKISTYLLYGLPALAGVYQGNVAMTNLLPYDPNKSMAENLGGAPVQLAAEFAKGGKALAEGNLDMFEQAVSPTSVNALRSFMNVLGSGQMISPRGIAALRPSSIGSAGEALGVAVGGRPISQLERESSNYFAYAAQQQKQKRRSEYMDNAQFYINDPAALRKYIEDGLKSGVITMNTTEEANALWRNIARTYLDRLGRKYRNPNLQSIQDINKIYEAYGISPEYESPVEVTIQAARLAAKSGDIISAGRLLQNITAQQVNAKVLIDRGMPPPLANILVKPTKNQNDIILIKQWANKLND